MITSFRSQDRPADCLRRPLPWVKATGRPETLSRKAAEYLRVFDHQSAVRFDKDVAILAKVISNLRNYYQQDAMQTTELVLGVFNPRAGTLWSPEGIKLTWDLVEGFTPLLGLTDETAVALRRATDATFPRRSMRRNMKQSMRRGCGATASHANPSF
jgi:hypothetical protein